MSRAGAAFRRQDFVEAAIQVIAEHGAAGATTRKIAAAVGSPLASLHYLFDTKEDLFLAVYESLLEQAIEPPLPPELAGASLGKVAAWQLRWAMNWFIQQPALARSQAELFFWALRNNRKLRIEPYQASTRGLRDFLSRAVDHRCSESAIDAVARLTLNLIDGLLPAWFAQDDLHQLQLDIDAASDALALFAAQRQARLEATAA